MKRTASLATLTLLASLVAIVLSAHPASADATSGSFSVLTYNLAGLPEGISGGNPSRNTRPIGERINAYDIVHVQEDFNYHADLYATDRHPHRTPTSGGAGFGDGLNTLSNYSYHDFTRDDWDACNGTDCWTPKGFTWSRIRLAEGVYVDFYNVHPNAGGSDADLAARRANLAELSRFIASHSVGNAVIVAGDTNTRYTRTGDTIRDLVSAHGLTDAWVEHVRGGDPPPAGSPALVCDDAHVTDECEVVDKILYRGNRFIMLRLTGYHNENAGFRTADDEMLSDHYPIAAWFDWTLRPELRMSDVFGGPHGAPFTDVDSVTPGQQVRRVSIRAGSRVDQVALTTADGTTLRHGGAGGTPSGLDLAPGEHIARLTLASGKKDGHTRIFHVRFVTSRGRVLGGGTPTSNQVTHTPPPGWQISGFHGRSGDEVDRLGVIYTPVTPSG